MGGIQSTLLRSTAPMFRVALLDDYQDVALGLADWSSLSPHAEVVAFDHPFRIMDDVLVSSHVGYVTSENYEVFYGDALEDIQAFLNGDVIRAMNEPLHRS